MKASKIIILSTLQISLLLVLLVGLNSCGTYQGAYNGDDDGIYASNNQTRNEVVIVENQSNFDQNYFSKQLEDLQNIKQEDTFTEIDDYYYDDASVQDDQLYTNYNEPWGYDGDVVININSGYGYMSPNYYWYNPFYYSFGYNPYPYSYYYYNPLIYNYYYPYYSYGYNPYHYGFYGNYYNPYLSYYENYPYYYGGRYESYGKRTSRNTGLRSNDNANLTKISRRSSIQNNSARGNVNTSTRRDVDGNLNRNNNINRNNTIDRQPTRSNNTIDRGSNNAIQRGSNNNSIQRSTPTRRNSSYNFSPTNVNRATSVNPNPNAIIRVNPNNSANQNSSATPNNVRRENSANNVRQENNSNNVRRENTVDTNNASSNSRSSGNDNSSVNRSSNTESRSSSSQSSSSGSSSRNTSRRD